MQLNTRKTNSTIKTMDERHKHSSKEEEFHTHTLIKISVFLFLTYFTL